MKRFRQKDRHFRELKTWENLKAWALTVTPYRQHWNPLVLFWSLGYRDHSIIFPMIFPEVEIPPPNVYIISKRNYNTNKDLFLKFSTLQLFFQNEEGRSWTGKCVFTNRGDCIFFKSSMPTSIKVKLHYKCGVIKVNCNII